MQTAHFRKRVGACTPGGALCSGAPVAEPLPGAAAAHYTAVHQASAAMRPALHLSRSSGLLSL